MASIAAPFPISGSAFAPFVARGPAVQTTTALAAVPVGERQDKQLRFVEDETNDYHFDQQSAAVESLPDIVEPDAGSGRWLRVTPAGGVPASHAASHSENASDEIFVENLGAISVVITDALMPDGTGGLVFGAPAPAAHALGGAQHTADTLANLNGKITDATLVDSSTVMLLDGTQAMTGTMTTQDVIPDGDGTRTYGSDAAGILTVITRNLRADTGQTFTIRDAAAVNSILIFPTGGIRFDQNMTLDPNGVRSFGTTTNSLLNMFTRNIRADDGENLAIKRTDDVSWATVQNGDVTNIGIGTRFINDVTLSFGNTDNAKIRWDTTQTNPHLILGVDTTTNVIVITGQDRIGTLNFGLGLFGTPALIVHDGSLGAGNWGAFQHNSADFVITSNAGAILLDPASNVISLGGATGTVSFGSDSLALAIVRTRSVRPDSGSLLIEDATGFNVITIADSGAITFAPNGDIVLDPGTNIVSLGGLTNTISLASGTVALANVFTRIVQADSGQSLLINRGNGANWVEIINAGNATFFINTGMADNFNFFWGTSTDAQMMWDTSQTNDALLLRLSGSNTFIIGTSSTPDLVLGVQSNPTLVIHDGSVTPGNFAKLSQSGLGFIVEVPANGGISLNTGATTRLRVESQRFEFFNNFGSHLEVVQSTEAHTLTLGATSDTTTIVIPAGAIVLGVAVRVTTAVTTSSGTNTFDVGDDGGADVNRYGADIAGAAGTTNRQGPADNQLFYGSITEIRFSAPGAETFTAGAIRVIVYYMIPIAPTS